MTAFSLRNTLTRHKEELRPREAGKISLYVCGVTPYDALHIGHARAFIVYDALRRVLEARGLEVTHVQNVTDVDDKIIQRAREVGTAPLELATRFMEESFTELDALGVLRAHHYPRVTGNIEPIIEMIATLEKKGFAYARKGDVYFDVSRDDDYGKLSGQKIEELESGARIEPGEHKDDPLDFALWKASKPGEPSWPSPWGDGRPGWHIECSAMALNLLGSGFDIHGGARELIFPHHENEVAQSESYLDGEPFARLWWHCGVVQVDGEKMSKSLGNFITVQDALNLAGKNVWRLLFLMTHPRSPLDYSSERLQQTKNAWARLRNSLGDAGSTLDQSALEALSANEAVIALEERFNAALDDDMNTPEALAAIFDMVSEWNRSQDVAPAVAARRSLEMLGFTLDDANSMSDELTPRLVELLIRVRRDARERRDFATSDAIRDELADMGIVLEDAPDGTRWRQGEAE